MYSTNIRSQTESEIFWVHFVTIDSFQKSSSNKFFQLKYNVYSLGGWNTGIENKDNMCAELKPGRKMFSMHQSIQIHLQQPFQLNDSVVMRMKIEWKTNYVKQPVQTETPDN